LIYGSGPKPFVYRALTPVIVRHLALASEHAFSLTGRDPSTDPVTRLGRRLLLATGAPAAARPYAHDYGICALVAGACFVGFGFVLSGLIHHYYPEYPRFVSDIVPIVSLFAIPLIFFRYANYIYDPTTLLLFTLCLYLIATRHHLLYAALFPVAVLNKETAVLLIPVYFVREIRESGCRRFALLSLCQIVTFVLIKLWLASLFRNNPGSFVEFHLHHNIEILAQSKLYLRTLAVLIPIAVLIAHRWREKPLLLRRGLVICLVPLVLPAVFLGYTDELRGYYEVYPIVVLLMIPTVMEALGISGSPHPGTLPAPNSTIAASAR
jgi:hypothetical protein